MSYSIKEVSEKLNISAYTLRYYEKEGLLPSIERNESGRRLYTDIDLGWIKLIGCMRATGMSISYIKNYVELCSKGNDTIPMRREIILKQKELIEEELRKYNEYLEVVNIKLSRYNDLSKTEANCLTPELKGYI